MRVTLNSVRLAFPALFEPKSFNGEGDPTFSASFILDPVANKADIQRLQAAIKQASVDKWNSKHGEVLTALQKKGHVCLHDGDEKSEYDGFAGNMYVSARSKSRPLVLDRDKSPLVASDGRPYAGCVVNAIVDVYAQDNQWGKRINAALSGVQFVRDGEAFGGSRPASADDFGTVDESEDLLV